MSYSISLVDKETGKTLELPTGLLAKSNNVHVKFDKNSGYFSPIGFTYAELNITYNYSKYFREVNENGIRAIYGKTAEESLKILEDMKEKILEKYYDKDTCQWLISVKERNRYFDKYGNEITNPISLVFDRKKNAECTVKTERYTIDEGPQEDYWEDTAGNAIEAINTLIDIANMFVLVGYGKKSIWEGD